MLCPKSADRRPGVTLLINKRKPIGIGEILVEEFLQPMGLPQGGPRQPWRRPWVCRANTSTNSAMIVAR